ncbi:MAG: hypothetical protein U5L09_15860 [Bacteroidales bacterium]|nr:hypothetical protein [Bacteroidales bacterium]
MSASNPEISVIYDFYDAISGAYIGSVEVSEEGETATGFDEGKDDKGESEGDEDARKKVAFVVNATIQLLLL